MIYREQRSTVDMTRGTTYRLQDLIARMATTDDPEEIVRFERAIAEEHEFMRDHVATIMDTAADLRASCDAIDEEMKRLDALKDQRAQRAERLELAVLEFMEIGGLSEIVTDLYTIRKQRNPAKVHISEEMMIPKEFHKVKTVELVSIDKKAIAELLKTGVPVPGASLVNSYRLEVK